MLNPILSKGGLGNFLFKSLLSYVMLRLYTAFQCPTIPGTGLKVCVVWWVWWWVCKPIIMFSLAQAEQYLEEAFGRCLHC